MNLVYVVFAIVILLMGYYIFNQQQDLSDAKAKLNKTLEKYAPIVEFANDYQEYTSICLALQHTNAVMVESGCTKEGYVFEQYYVGYPNNEYVMICHDPNTLEKKMFRFRLS